MKIQLDTYTGFIQSIQFFPCNKTRYCAYNHRVKITGKEKVFYLLNFVIDERRSFNFLILIKYFDIIQLNL